MTRTKETKPPVAAPVRVIRDKAFGVRLATALDHHPTAPPVYHGRLTWLKAELAKVGMEISLESARKWFSGETRPRHDKMKVVARVLGVDEGWLSLGIQPDMQPRERKVRNAVVDGAVNFVAGLIQMDGGHPAFPEEGDKRAEAGVDVYAIIKGAQYAFAVSMARAEGEGAYRFAVPLNYEDMFVIGLVRVAPMEFVLLELSTDVIDAHKERNKGGYLELGVEVKKTGYVAGTDVLRRITGFSERL